MIKQKYLALSSVAIIFFILIVPRVCAQPVSVTAEKAAELRLEMIDYGKKFLGKPYASGGIGPDSFDCSGFTYAVASASVGIQLPRTARGQYSYTSRIKFEELQAGDLVFFRTTSSGTISHVGLYIGNDEFIHSASAGPSTGIIITNIKTDKYWNRCYAGAGRLLTKAEESALMPKEEKSQSEEKTEKAPPADDGLELVTEEMLI